MIHKIQLVKISLRSFTCYSLYIISTIAGCIFMYRVMFDLSNVKTLYDLGIPLDVAIFSGILAIYCEEIQVVTQRQWRANRFQKREAIMMLSLWITMNVILFILHQNNKI